MAFSLKCPWPCQLFTSSRIYVHFEEFLTIQSHLVKYFGISSDVIVLGLNLADGGSGQAFFDLERVRLVDEFRDLVVRIADFNV